MTRLEGGQLQFTWEPRMYDDIAHPGDQIMLQGIMLKRKLPL
jgi:hypothetical protein